MKTFYLYIVLLFSLGCKAQEFDLRDMKRFDEKVFKDWEVDTSKLVFPGTTYLKKGNDRVEISIGEKTKQIKLTNIIDPYMYVYRYYAKTDILMQESKFFYSVLIGKTFTYNERFFASNSKAIFLREYENTGEIPVTVIYDKRLPSKHFIKELKPLEVNENSKVGYTVIGILFMLLGIFIVAVNFKV